MSLLDNAIWWQVYPLGACGAPIRDRQGDDAGHRLPRLLPWLDYAVELGASGLLLGPIFESLTHGYDTIDHFRIDSRLGDDADFDALVGACRERGLSLMLDGVFNHVSTAHWAIEAGLAGPDVWEGHDSLASLHHDDPRVADLVVDVMLHWLRRGIAGWRLDVAYAVPSEFWAQVLPRVRAEFPGAIFLGEVIHGDYAALAAAGKLDSITQYELWKGTWSAIKDANLWELAHALDRHAAFSETVVLNTFIGNHDVDRIASLVGHVGEVLALSILMTVPGMPSIYYGDEQGFTGTRGDGFAADDAVRPPLPAAPEEMLGDGWWLYRMHQRLIGLRRRHPWITRGRVEVIERDNTAIVFSTTGEGHSLFTSVTLDPASVTITADGETVFNWTPDSE